MLGIVIVTYNTPVLINKQIELIKKFCLDDFQIIISDNSTDQQAADSIKYHSKQSGVYKYIRTKASSYNGSESHAFSSNTSYSMFKNDYEYFFYLDHDQLGKYLQMVYLPGSHNKKARFTFGPAVSCLKTFRLITRLLTFQLTINTDLTPGVIFIS